MKSRCCLCLLSLLVGLSPVSGQTSSSGATIKTVDKNVLEFFVGKELVARYNAGPDVPKPYFFPVMAPGGLKVTRGVPPDKGDATDHPHQTSAWFCHGDVIPEGIELNHKVKGVKGVDYWSIAPGHGKMVCVKVQFNSGASPVDTWNEWRTADDVKVLDEKRTIALDPVEGGYLFVLDIDLHASVCPITFGDTKEGSMGVRVPNAMTEKFGKGTLTNAEGKTGMKNIWGGQSNWCDYSGPVAKGEDAAVAGIAIFDHPDNKPRACWHSRDYGLMAANPFGRKTAGFPAVKDEPKLVRLEKGEHLKLRYGLFLHKGDVKEGKVAEAYARFAKGK
jgi:hypothetical protein